MKSLTTLLAEIEKEFDEKYSHNIGLSYSKRKMLKIFLRSQIKKVLKEVGEEIDKSIWGLYEYPETGTQVKVDIVNKKLDQVRNKLSAMTGGGE